MNKIVANLVVDFGGGDGDVVLELDDVLNVENFSEYDQRRYAYYGFLPNNVDADTVSNFSPGDPVYFRMQYDEREFELSRLTVTHGQIEEIREDLRSTSQVLLWTNDGDEHDLAYRVNKITPSSEHGKLDYYGNAAYTKLSGPKTLVLSDAKKNTLPANTYIEYDSKFMIYKLIAPDVELGDGETYPITIVAYMRPV